jgi:glycosyltransferase involved in cell wall biosynthesis
MELVDERSAVKQKARSSPASSLPAGTSVVYFGNDWFAINRTSSHHIARRLAARFPLLYVESPGMRAPKTSGRDWSKVWRKLWGAFQLPRQIDRQMWHMIVPQIPFRRLPFIKALNQVFGVILLKRAMKKIGLRGDLVWFASPDMGLLAGKLSEQLSVYYCIDDYASLPGVDAREIARLDEELARRAGQVFVSSPALVEGKLKLNPSTKYSPHGVEVALFERACDPDLEIAAGARDLRHPVIGFFGAVEAWVDLELLSFLGRAKPEWTFLMIGRAEVPMGELEHMPNFIFVGPKPYETLPSWAKAFDVAIIPFRQNELVRNVNPLKLREYLATGKPVVSVPMPELKRFAHCVGLASTPEEFLREIERALSEDDDDKRLKRRREVSGMTWDARVTEVLEVVAAKFPVRAKS